MHELLRCRWERFLLMNFEVDPAALQPQVPFELDLFRGRAWVSCVAFDLTGMELVGAPRWIQPVVRAIGSNAFLNVRTYVRIGGETGIFFITEWLNNAPAVLFGPLAYGLPYRWGRLDYRHEHEKGSVRGTVRAGDRLAWRGTISSKSAKRAGLAEFLMERYTAFTARVRPRRFEVAHAPWMQSEADVEMLDTSLLAATGPWHRAARFAGANYSIGTDVVMGAPEPLSLRTAFA